VFDVTDILFHIDSKYLSDVLSFIFILEHDLSLLGETLDVQLFFFVLQLSQSLFFLY
jgi:hypothetical protein